MWTQLEPPYSTRKDSSWSICAVNVTSNIARGHLGRALKCLVHDPDSTHKPSDPSSLPCSYSGPKSDASTCCQNLGLNQGHLDLQFDALKTELFQPKTCPATRSDIMAAVDNATATRSSASQLNNSLFFFKYSISSLASRNLRASSEGVMENQQHLAWSSLKGNTTAFPSSPVSNRNHGIWKPFGSRSMGLMSVVICLAKLGAPVHVPLHASKDQSAHFTCKVRTFGGN